MQSEMNTVMEKRQMIPNRMIFWKLPHSVKKTYGKFPRDTQNLVIQTQTCTTVHTYFGNLYKEITFDLDATGGGAFIINNWDIQYVCSFCLILIVSVKFHMEIFFEIDWNILLLFSIGHLFKIDKIVV